MDPHPTVVPIPPLKTHRICAIVPVRKPKIVLDGFLQTLAAQQLTNATLDVVLAPNYAPSDPEAGECLRLLEQAQDQFPETMAVTVLPNDPPTNDGYGDGSHTRTWTAPAFLRLAAFKDRLLEQALVKGYDYVWALDADVLCDPFTCQSLLDADAPVVFGVYWTYWQRPDPNLTMVVHAGPQVWLTGSYGLSGRGWTEPEFRKALIDRQRVRVWGGGSCTLIRKDVLEKGVRFQKRMALPAGPMSEGEDRQFCAQATILHVPLIADGWPDIYHAYHPHEYETIPDRVAMLQSRQALRHCSPQPGWLVSAKITNLETPHVPPAFVRGRLGNLKVLPQIEETLGTLTPGQSTLLKVAFPIHWPEAQLRNQNCVMQVKLLDCKPYVVPPVIDGELFVGTQTGAVVDQTTLTEQQCKVVAGE